MTNYERIKNMSVEEMAEFFDVIREQDICLNPKCEICAECFYDLWCSYPHKKSMVWLKSEVTQCPEKKK